ncbi:MAG: prephenate dehydrogenase/arogenate dehydrogenase family protein [Rickettsiales bacterium TMED289]|nr:MAG: prephenate dehydrogenase/arogenate dehydrogenase family protein [Rickettsiales bacterium TMED289]
MNRVSIMGFGRFGATLHSLLSKGFEVDVYDKTSINNPEINEVTILEALKNDIIFIAVPIRDFESIINEIKNDISGQKTVVDVCSVKVFPKDVMLKNLPAEIDIIATHPLFGPDSLKDSGSVMTMESVRDNYERYNFWKNYFNSQNIIIEEITAEEHDMMAARSQGLTHLIGRVIDDFGTNQTRIDTEGYKVLHKLVNQTCNDSWELFEDIQNYNPFTKKNGIRA